jgi:hypothetical protein
LKSFLGIAGLSDEDFAKRRQEYRACAMPVLTTLREQLFGKERIAAIEEAAALDRSLTEENAIGWKQVDAALEQIRLQCGQEPGDFVRRYTHRNNSVADEEFGLSVISMPRHRILVHGSIEELWWYQEEEKGFIYPQRCASGRVAPCINYGDPIVYEMLFDALPTVEAATTPAQLVCHFTFGSNAGAIGNDRIRGKGTLEVATGQVKFIAGE